MYTGGAFAENAYLATCGETGQGVIIDPGAGTPALLEAVRERNTPIQAILLTHAHLDHIDGLALAKRETGAPIYLHPNDQVLYDNGAAQAAAYGVPFEAPPPPDEALAEGDQFSFGECMFEVRFTPGHAPGHVVFVEHARNVTFVGDVVFAGSIGRTDLPGGNFKQLMESIRGQILALPSEMTLYPGHGPETNVGHERTSNPFLIPLYGGEMA